MDIKSTYRIFIQTRFQLKNNHATSSNQPRCVCRILVYYIFINCRIKKLISYSYLRFVLMVFRSFKCNKSFPVHLKELPGFQHSYEYDPCAFGAYRRTIIVIAAAEPAKSNALAHSKGIYLFPMQFHSFSVFLPSSWPGMPIFSGCRDESIAFCATFQSMSGQTLFAD